MILGVESAAAADVGLTLMLVLGGVGVVVAYNAGMARQRRQERDDLRERIKKACADRKWLPPEFLYSTVGQDFTVVWRNIVSIRDPDGVPLMFAAAEDEVKSLRQALDVLDDPAGTGAHRPSDHLQAVTGKYRKEVTIRGWKHRPADNE